jgi:integrase
MHLTKSKIDRLKYAGDGASRDVRWDDAAPGFGVRIYPSGRKAFVLSYRADGRKRLMTLGDYGVLTLEQARARTLREKASILDGGDPLDLRNRNRQAQTIAELSDLYLSRYAVRKKSAEADERRIRQWLKPKWGSRQAKSLRRDEIAAEHAELGESIEYEANRRLALLRRMLNLAKQWGVVEESWPNPATGIPMHPERSRDRWVRADELPRLADAIDQEPNVYIRSALWLYLLTGMRKSELLTARWADIDWDRRELRLGETKGGQPHYVPLSPAALAIVQAIPRQDGNPYLLAGARAGQHLVNVALAWGRIRKRAGIEDVRLHDLRRTAGSWLAQAGNDLHLVGSILGHRNLSTTRIYARLGQDVMHRALDEHGVRIMAAARKNQPAEVVGLIPAKK